MSVVDVFIPLIAGVLLLARPQMFIRNAGSGAEAARKTARIRTIGYVLLGVAVLYFVIGLVETR